MELLAQLLIGAILIEALVDTVKRVYTKTIQWEYFLALAVGILVAVVYGLDLPAVAGLVTAVPFVGAILTGIILSRGANYLYEILQRLGIGTSFRQPSG